MNNFLQDGQVGSVEMFAQMIEHYIFRKTMQNVKIKLPLVTEREKELFITIINKIENE